MIVIFHRHHAIRIFPLQSTFANYDLPFSIISSYSECRLGRGNIVSTDIPFAKVRDGLTNNSWHEGESAERRGTVFSYSRLHSGRQACVRCRVRIPASSDDQLSALPTAR